MYAFLYRHNPSFIFPFLYHILLETVFIHTGFHMLMHTERKKEEKKILHLRDFREDNFILEMFFFMNERNLNNIFLNIALVKSYIKLFMLMHTSCICW